MSVTKVQDDLIVFQNVPNSYPPSEDVEVRFERKEGTTVTSHDWVGLFRIGWTSVREYYTFEWAPMSAKDGEERSGMKVVFSRRRLPQDDGQKYQFCYINRNGTLYGSSGPFQFTKTTQKTNYRETNPVEGKLDESVVILTADGGVGKEPECDEDLEHDSLIVINSLRQELARSIEGRKAVQAECEKLKQQGSSTMETLVLREREMQATREQMEGLVKKLSGKIDQLENHLLEKQKLCVSDMERHSQKLASESGQLNQKLSECVAEVKLLKDRLEHEGGLRKKLEQQLMAVELLTKTMKSTTALQKEVHDIVSSVHTSAKNEVHSTKSTKTLECSAPSYVDQNALEALQLAYGTIEKYYHTTYTELEACQNKLQESQNIVAVLQQKCIELEAQVADESNFSIIRQASTKQTPSSNSTFHVRDLEQRLEESESRCKMLVSGEEQYKRKIEELQHQLHDEKRNIKLDSDVKGKFATDVVLQQLKKLVEILKSNKADSDIGYLLNELEIVVADMRGTRNIPDASNSSEVLQAGFRQCPICKLEFPQTMTQKKFERHIQKHSET